MVKILSIFVAFLENINFNYKGQSSLDLQLDYEFAQF